MIDLVYLYNFCCVALVIRIYPALNSTEVLRVSNKDSQNPKCVTSSLFVCPDGIVPSVMMSSDYWPHVANATKKKGNRTCLSYYVFSKSEYNHFTNCMLQMFIKKPKPNLFIFSDHEEFLHIYIIPCKL